MVVEGEATGVKCSRHAETLPFWELLLRAPQSSSGHLHVVSIQVPSILILQWRSVPVPAPCGSKITYALHVSAKSANSRNHSDASAQRIPPSSGIAISRLEMKPHRIYSPLSSPEAYSHNSLALTRRSKTFSTAIANVSSLSTRGSTLQHHHYIWATCFH
jgi:hypothetical protein